MTEAAEERAGTDSAANRPVFGNQGQKNGQIREDKQRPTGGIHESVRRPKRSRERDQDIQGLLRRIAELEDRREQLERQKKQETSELAVERSERSRLEELVASLRLELSQVTDRLNRTVTQNTELKISLRQLEDSSSGHDIEQKMLDKVKELEKSNLETLLKTYKG